MMVMPMVMRDPAPSPWMARNTMSWAMLWDSPDSAEPRRKMPRPVTKTRRRPSWSANRPQSGMDTVEARR